MILSLITFVLLALTLVACLAQFLLLKREVWRLGATVRDQQDKLRDSVDSLEAQLEELRAQVAEQAACRPGPPGASINLTRRARVLRLHRHGDRADQIAASLNLPQNEVALLLKLHDLDRT